MSVGVVITSYNLIMCGWRNNFKICISRLRKQRSKVRRNTQQMYMYMQTLYTSTSNYYTGIHFIFSATSRLEILWRLSILMATLCPVSSCSACFTLPNVPTPSVAPRMYLFTGQHGVGGFTLTIFKRTWLFLGSCPYLCPVLWTSYSGLNWW